MFSLILHYRTGMYKFRKVKAKGRFLAFFNGRSGKGVRSTFFLGPDCYDGGCQSLLPLPAVYFLTLCAIRYLFSTEGRLGEGGVGVPRVSNYLASRFEHQRSPHSAVLSPTRKHTPSGKCMRDQRLGLPDAAGVARRTSDSHSRCSADSHRRQATTILTIKCPCCHASQELTDKRAAFPSNTSFQWWSRVAVWHLLFIKVSTGVVVCQRYLFVVSCIVTTCCCSQRCAYSMCRFLCVHNDQCTLFCQCCHLVFLLKNLSSAKHTLPLR